MFLLSIIIIVVTIIGVSLGRYPFLRMNRASIAFVGAVLLVLINSISLNEAFNAIDLNTIVLLFAIMILNVNFRLSGFFYLITNYILKYAETPRHLLGVVIMFAGLLSAVFLNDTIVLVFTPIVLEITISLKRNPLPYLIALVASANIGSAATIIGNPQNIIIGTFSGITFVDFSFYLIPVSLIGLLVVWIFIVLLYKNEFLSTRFEKISPRKSRVYLPLLKKTLLATSLMLLALILGVSTAIAALGAAALLLITRRLKPERVFKEVDWSLLVFFSGLFIVTKSIDTIGVSSQLIHFLKISSGNEIVDLTILSTISSNLISNVPAVLLLKNIVQFYSNVEISWITMSMATTFAGNLTLLGSVANLIVAESAKKRGVVLSFSEYLRAGVLITITTLILGILWLNIFY